MIRCPDSAGHPTQGDFIADVTARGACIFSIANAGDSIMILAADTPDVRPDEIAAVARTYHTATAPIQIQTTDTAPTVVDHDDGPTSTA